MRKRHSVAVSTFNKADVSGLLISSRYQTKAKKSSDDRKAQAPKILEDTCSTSLASSSFCFCLQASVLVTLTASKIIMQQMSVARARVLIGLQESGMKFLDWANEMVSNNSVKTGKWSPRRKVSSPGTGLLLLQLFKL